MSLYIFMINFMTRQIDTEQYNRRKNLIITGITESIKQKDLVTTVIYIIQSTGLQISSYEVVRCHRLFKPKHSKYPAKTNFLV